MKKGIVLLMTLGFIAVITAMIFWSVSISKKRFDRVGGIDSQNQFNIIFSDFSKVLKKGDFNSSDKLNVLLSICFPPIVDAKSGMGVGFCAKSMMDRLNINYMLDTIISSEKNSSKELGAKYFQGAIAKYLSTKELSDPYLFISILLDTIDLDQIERSTNSEISEEDQDFREGRIYDFNQFKKIEDQYYKITLDSSVYTIDKEDFERYFYFGDPKTKPLLDCSNISNSNKDGIKELLPIISDEYIEIGEGMDICKEINSTLPNDLKKIYNISKYSNKSKYLVRCRLTLVNEYNQEEISFDYEVNSKRISNIDKTFQ